MRVTQNQLYTNFISNMNSSLSDLVKLNIQASSQKRINSPMDDPAGMARVLDHRKTLNEVSQFKENVSSATGWLNLADATLLQVSTVVVRAKELAEQLSTGTLQPENRAQISSELRQLFGQLVNLSNTEYEDKHIFAGQKVDDNAFVEQLWLMANDSSLDTEQFSITGSLPKTAMVQFYSTSDPSGTNVQLNDPDLRFRYSIDGGSTWTTGQNVTINGGEAQMNVNGAQVTMNATASVTTNDATEPENQDGTWFWIRPTAQYLGDDEDHIDVRAMGTSTIQGSAQGDFDGNVLVRIDEPATALDQTITYSYSQDGGVSWTQRETVTDTSAASNATLPIPGGYLVLASNGGQSLAGGEQFVVTPRSAAINVEIAYNSTVQINSIGKDIFGGVYQDPSSTGASVVNSDHPDQNLFDVMGRLIAYAETNNQAGCQQCLEDLKSAQSHVMVKTAEIAGRENRLAVASSVLTTLKLNEEERLSIVEDVDVGDLMTQLAQKQITYEAVLKSSSMIMNLSLVNMV